MEWPLPLTNPETVGLNPKQLDKLSTRMHRFVDEKGVPGMITVIVRDGKIAHHDCYGVKDIASQTPMAYDDIFRIYSMTKIICATSIMLLVEDGLVQLGDPVEKFFPAVKRWRVKEGDKRVQPRCKVTLHHLLTHTGGLSYDRIHDAKTEGLDYEAFMEEYADIPLIQHPGEKWNYSASNDVLGFVVEKVTGKAMDEFLKERIFGPLGMVDTDFYVPDSKLDRLVTAYAATAPGEFEVPNRLNSQEVTKKPSILGMGGGLLSTTSDYLRFAHMLMNGGQWDGQHIISPKSIALMASDQLPARHPNLDINNMRYGLSVEVVTDSSQLRNHGSVGQWGWGGAASTQVWFDPAEDMLIMIMMQIFGSEHNPPILGTYKSMATAALC